MSFPSDPSLAARRLSVVIIYRGMVRGGAEQHVLDLCKGLKDRGHRVAFAGLLNGWAGQACLRIGIECCHVPMRGMYDPVSMLKLAMFCRSVGADLIHGHSMRGYQYAKIAGKLLSLPVIATCHSTLSHKRLRGAGSVIAVSEAVSSHLRSHGRDIECIHVVRNGIEDPISQTRRSRAEVRGRLGIDDHKIVFGMAARCIYKKGQDVAVEALARCKEPNAHLLLVGVENNAFFKQFNQRISDLRLSTRVSLVPQNDQVPEWMGAMDVLLAPSRIEPLSLSIIEAMAMRLPVIASRVGGIPEVVDDGVSGMLVDPEDPDVLASKMDLLAGNTSLRSSLSSAGRRRYLGHFSRLRMIESTETAYTHCISQWHRRSSHPVDQNAVGVIRTGYAQRAKSPQKQGWLTSRGKRISP